MRLIPTAFAAGFAAFVPVVAAHAATLTVSGISKASGSVYELTVPTVEVEDGTLTEAQVKAIFDGDASVAPALATLDAKSITIPEITVVTNAGEGSSTAVYHDLEITGVAHGVATSASLGGIDVTGANDTTVSFGKTSVTNLDIGALLAFYGLGGQDVPAEPVTLYSNIHMDGGKVVTKDVTCAIAPADIAEFKARPPKSGQGGIMELASRMEAETKGGASPDPKLLAALINAYADFISSFEMSPVAFNGVDCTGKSEKGNPLKVTLGGFSMDAWKQAVFPAISISGLTVDVADEGYFTLESATLKKMDFTGTLALLKSAGDNLTPDWFTRNYRLLIPALDGLSFSGLAMDVPDDSHPGQKTRIQIGGFDMALAGYAKGVPAHTQITLDDFVMPIPDVGQPLTEALKAVGVTEANIDAGFTFDWDSEAKTATISNLNLHAQSLGSVVLAADLGNVTADVFSDNMNVAERARQKITVKSLHLVLENLGVLPILIAQGAQQSGQTDAAFRATLVGVSSGLTMALLGASPQTLGTASAIADFIAGRPNLDITLTATDPNGIGSAEFEAAQKDPTVLAGKIAVTATATGDIPVATQPAPAPAPTPDAVPAPDAAPAMSETQSEKQGDKAPPQ